MNDFAAAAMLRVIGLGLRRLGIELPLAPTRSQGAHVALADKRALLSRLHGTHGVRTLLRLGEGLRDARAEPALTALTLAEEPRELLERWRRLERFVHSRHRTEVAQTGERCIQLHHVSLLRDQPPSDAEHLVVAGLLVALAEHTGTTGLRAWPTDQRRWRYAAGKWPQEEPPRTVDWSRWTFAWDDAGPRPAPAHLLDDDFLRSTASVLAGDLCRRWRIASLSAAMGVPPRTLQRRLQDAGSSFSALLLDVRLGHAAGLLATTRHPVAQVGYVCGFADQAHFTRTFKLHTATTPMRYRERFAVESSCDFESARVRSALPC